MLMTTKRPLEIDHATHKLTELRRLEGKLREYEREAAPDPALVRLLHWSVYATYRDCRALGLEGVAREVVERGRSAAQ